jgi:hypothetical protein
MITLETLNETHLEGFKQLRGSEVDIPRDHLGNGLVLLKDGELLALLTVWVRGATAVLGAIVTEQCKRYPIALSRNAKFIFKGLKLEGFSEAHAHAGNEISDRWLKSLGFIPSGGEDLWGHEVYIKKL